MEKKGLHGKIVLWLMVMVCGIAAVIGLFSTIRKEEDQITITPEVLYGDPSIVEGMTVQIRTEYSDTLRWTTDFAIGQEEKAQTKVERLASQGLKEQNDLNVAKVANNFNVNQIIGGGSYQSSNLGVPLLDDYYNGQIQWLKDQLGQALVDVASKCEPGGSTVQTIWLEEYFEYYPAAIRPMYITEELGIWQDGAVHIPENNYEWTKPISKVVSQYFQIPVIKDDRVTIMLEKDDQGEISSISFNAWKQSGYGAGSAECASDKGIYFVMHMFPNHFDYSRVPGGYGLYFLPMVMTEGTYCAVPDELTTILSLDPDHFILNLWSDENGDTVVLQRYNDAEQGLIFDIVDVPSGQIIQTIGCGVTPEWDGYDKTRKTVGKLLLRDDYMVMELLYDSIMLYQKTPDGTFEFCFAVDTAQDEEMIRQWNPGFVYLIEDDRVGMDFSGEYLAFSWAMPYGQEFAGESCDIYVGVYGKEGLVYYGVYHNSLSIGGEEYFVTDRIALTAWNPITLRWPETK